MPAANISMTWPGSVLYGSRRSVAVLVVGSQFTVKSQMKKKKKKIKNENAANPFVTASLRHQQRSKVPVLLEKRAFSQ
jgi:hypothetical protein